MKKIILCGALLIIVLINNAQELQSFEGADLLEAKFKLCNSFTLRIPKNMRYEIKLNPEGGYYFNPKKGKKAIPICDKIDAIYNSSNFIDISVKKYRVEVYSLLGGVLISSPECKNFQKGKEALLFGMEGLILISELSKKKLPQFKNILSCYVSFDQKEDTWLDYQGNSMIPVLYGCKRGGWSFALSDFEAKWIGEKHYLICFLPMPEKNKRKNKGLSE